MIPLNCGIKILQLLDSSYDVKYSNEQDTQQLCSVHRPISLDKLIFKLLVKLTALQHSQIYLRFHIFMVFTVNYFPPLSHSRLGFYLGFSIPSLFSTWSYSEESVLWVDCSELTLLIWSQPGNIVSNYTHLYINISENAEILRIHEIMNNRWI